MNDTITPRRSARQSAKRQQEVHSQLESSGSLEKCTKPRRKSATSRRYLNLFYGMQCLTLEILKVKNADSILRKFGWRICLFSIERIPLEHAIPLHYSKAVPPDQNLISSQELHPHPNVSWRLVANLILSKWHFSPNSVLQYNPVLQMIHPTCVIQFESCFLAIILHFDLFVFEVTYTVNEGAILCSQTLLNFSYSLRVRLHQASASGMMLRDTVLIENNKEVKTVQNGKLQSIFKWLHWFQCFFG